MSGSSVDFRRLLEQVEAGEVVVDPDYLGYLRWVANGRPDIVVLSDDSEEEEEGSESSDCTVVGRGDEEIRPEKVLERREELKRRSLEREKKREERKKQLAKECLEKNLFLKDSDEAGPSFRRFRDLRRKD